MEGREAAPARRLRRGATALVLAVPLAWAAVAVTQLSGVWLFSRIGPLAWAVSGLAWLVAVAATALVAAAFCLVRRFLLAGMAFVVGAAGATAIVRTDWTAAFVHGYYERHHAGFLAVAELARTHQLDPFPAELRYLAFTGDPIVYGASTVYLPAWTGIVDGVTGYAFIGDPPAGSIVECAGDPCQVRWSLGDGWSWIDMYHR